MKSKVSAKPVCPVCGGEAKVTDTMRLDCMLVLECLDRVCGVKRLIPQPKVSAKQDTCPRCGGTGKWDMLKRVCLLCHGSGKVSAKPADVYNKGPVGLGPVCVIDGCNYAVKSDGMLCEQHWNLMRKKSKGVVSPKAEDELVKEWMTRGATIMDDSWRIRIRSLIQELEAEVNQWGIEARKIPLNKDDDSISRWAMYIERLHLRKARLDELRGLLEKNKDGGKK
jgi:hypothetical protein